MARTQAAVKVGVVVVIATLLLFGVAYFFFGRAVGGYPVVVRFRDAQGIVEQADVRLAGVKVGTVEKVRVDDTGRGAVLRLRIQPDEKIPEGSVFTITSGGLLGEMFVQITPPPRTAAVSGYLPESGPVPVVQGKDVPTFDDIKEQVAELGTSTQDLLNNLKVVSSNVASITQDPVLRESLRNTARNAQIASAQGAVAAARVNATIAHVNASIDQVNRVIASEVPALRATLANIERTTRQGEPLARNANKALASVDQLVQGLNETNSFLRQTIADTLEQAQPGPALHEMLGNLEKTSVQLEGIAQDIHKITTDLSTTQGSNTKVGEAVTQVGSVAEKANTLLDRLTGVTERAGHKRGRLIPGAAQFDAYQRVDKDARFRADLNYALPLGNSAVILGLYDLGESNKLTLQNSVASSARTRLRYGFYASKLGVGADYLFSGSSLAPSILGQAGDTSLSLDLYNPNDVHVNLYGRRQMNDKLGLVVGVEDLFDHSYPTLGLTYRP